MGDPIFMPIVETEANMSEELAKAETDRQAIVDAKAKGRAATFTTYARLSGPGWLQSALTLGGGTLGSSLYLGVLSGFALLWLQPFAMLLGVVMLCAVNYVTLCAEDRPFHAINRHLHPLLGWAWLIGALLANIIWALPQYALASSVLQDNLLPDLLGDASAMGLFGGKVAITATVLFLCVAAAWTYNSGGWGLRLYEWTLRCVVIGIVLCFIGVVVVVALQGNLDWGRICWGFIPDFGRVWRPAESLTWLLDAVPTENHAFWTNYIVNEQRQVLFAAASATVGINSMFLLSYSILRRGWNRDFRGLATFDLWIGMFVPFLLVTSCIVMASTAQFHPVEDHEKALLEPGNADELPAAKDKTIEDLEKALLRHEIGAAEFHKLSNEEVTRRLPQLSRAELLLAFHVDRKDAIALSQSLSKLAGQKFAIWIFGIGVLGMTLSSISLQMIGCGFVVCEAFGVPPKGWPHRLGSLVAIIGVLGPFIWTGSARFWLVVPTSMATYTLLPLAYITFFLAMNSKGLLGDRMPRGGRRVGWNLAMGIATLLTIVGTGYMVFSTSHSIAQNNWGWQNGGWLGLGLVGVLAAIVVVVCFAFPRRRPVE
jgi:Mn2+/Fe2+ NRAMP family transporter